jgi:hypothetical protein
MIHFAGWRCGYLPTVLDERIAAAVWLPRYRVYREVGCKLFASMPFYCP